MKYSKDIFLLKRNAWVLAGILTLVLMLSLFWNWQQMEKRVHELAFNSLKLSFEKDLVYRRWVTNHGGVYAPVSEHTSPNPYLSHIPERDIISPSGIPLTLINPAYMTRQVHELGRQQYGIKGNLTSLKPLRPENMPDEWEEQALKKFDEGVKEAHVIMKMDNISYMRLMRPFTAEESCLKCHGHQGYKTGNILGGISVSTPMSPYLAHIKSGQYTLFAGHLTIWLGGLLFISMMTSRIVFARMSGEAERKQAEEELKTAIEFLNLLNESKSTEDLIKKAVDFISQKTGCEAIGIRLKKEHDYPYCETRGFSKTFVLRENSLCARDEKGRICFDRTGNPVLECMCDNVICGRFDPAKPFFTARGSFWTNSTTELLAQTTEADRQSRTRNRCNGEGYESVALIPLRCGEQRLGILQLNDKRKAFFNIKTILMWERLGNYLAVSLSKLAAEEAVQQMNATLEQRVADRTALAEARTKQLQSLAVELIEIEERERQQFAHLLHEDLQQMLAAAKIQLQPISDKFPNEPAIVSVEHILKETIVKSRHLSHELSPPVLHHSGLSAALQWLGNRMNEQFNLVVEFETNVEPRFDYIPLKTFLFRAVQELLFNVVKHAGVKHARVVFSGSDTNLSVFVRDYGQGFNPEILNNLTNKAGFGLISIRERASYIGGSLTVDSAPGKGSRFTLSIPLKISNENESLLKESSADELKSHVSEAPSVCTSGGGIRVLFADDHDVMRQGLIKLISGQPNILVVGEAANGLEALEQARKLKPDVVVMDVSMPEMDGVEATRRIKAELPEIRVITLSMYEDDQIVRTMSEAGAEAFVSKSASTAKLLKAIYGVEPG